LDARIFIGLALLLHHGWQSCVIIGVALLLHHGWQSCVIIGLALLLHHGWQSCVIICCLSGLSFCEQVNLRVRQWMLTKHGIHRQGVTLQKLLKFVVDLDPDVNLLSVFLFP